MSTFRWKMETPCVDCPFNRTGPGAHLGRSLGRGRMAGIKAGLRRGESFNCHKTTDETGNGTNLLCAGALAFQARHGISNQMDRIGERLAWIAERRKHNATEGDQ